MLVQVRHNTPTWCMWPSGRWRKFVALVFRRFESCRTPNSIIGVSSRNALAGEHNCGLCYKARLSQRLDLVSVQDAMLYIKKVL